MTEKNRDFDELGDEANTASGAANAERKKQFTEPKLTFIEPKLVNHGDMASNTAGGIIGPVSFPGVS